MNETYKVAEAAARMGVAPETLRTMMIRKETPFGMAFRRKNGRWQFIIPRGAFDKFMNGEVTA